MTCTITNTRDKGSVKITKEFNPQASGYTGTFDINYTCVDGANKVKEGTVKLAAGKSETISGLPTGTVCTVTEPNVAGQPERAGHSTRRRSARPTARRQSRPRTRPRPSP